MLSWSFVLQRIKEEFSLPFQVFEKTDEEIIDYLKRNALKKYSLYFPQKWRLSFDTGNSAIQVPGRVSEYYLVDPDEREIFNITEFVPRLGDYLILGHPHIGAYSFNQVPEFLLRTFESMNTKLWSEYNYTTEFIPPNQFRLSPQYRGLGVIEYERMHDSELSTIDTEKHDLFVDLCYGMIGMMIGRIRKKYSPLQTPFGEIPLNADDIFNDAKEVYDKVIDKLDRGAIPNVIFDRG